MSTSQTLVLQEELKGWRRMAFTSSPVDPPLLVWCGQLWQRPTLRNVRYCRLSYLNQEINESYESTGKNKYLECKPKGWGDQQGITTCNSEGQPRRFLVGCSHHWPVGTCCRQEWVTVDVPLSPAVGLLFSFLFSHPSPGWNCSCKGHQTSDAASHCYYPWKKIASLKLITKWHFSSEKLHTWAL